ncbi:MAG TPA: hypothetical protein RMH99_08025 [Sandaracinaceae bacterium LLY-WYZ-13_1]|nr:hypothetical protein [Sandaracinaceae bacterium LLY-WYZ-13_1]
MLGTLLVTIGTFALGLGVVLFVVLASAGSGAAKRAYRTTARVPVAAARPGGALVAVEGVVVPGPDGAFASPVTGRPAVLLGVEVLERQGDEWVTCDAQEERRPFLLQDESGELRIDPSTATLELLRLEVRDPRRPPPRDPGRLRTPLTPELEAYARGYGVVAHREAGITEWWIAPGERLYARGRVELGPHGPTLAGEELFLSNRSDLEALYQRHAVEGRHLAAIAGLSMLVGIGVFACAAALAWVSP